MDAYDWDQTIYRKDSTAGFFLFCARRYPAVRRFGFIALRIAIRHVRGLPPLREQKQAFYRYLAKVPDVASCVREFWAENAADVGFPAMPVHPQPGDAVISASPEFLLRDVVAGLGLELVAGRIDPTTGELDGLDCYGEEKVRRFREAFGEDARISSWYSDSLSDAPMAGIAERAFLVRPEGLTPWPGTNA